MIGGFVGKLLDVGEARRETENLWRAYDQLVQDHAEALGRVQRLEKDLKESRAQVADYRMAADGDTRRLAADNAHLRSERIQLFERSKVVVAEREAAVAARRVAESALSALQLNPAGDRWKAEAERHKANATRLSDALCELRESTEKQITELLGELAALRERLETCDKEHPG